MRFLKPVALMLSLVAATGCYHQVIRSGKAPGTKVVEKPWTATWLWGLVPATPIDVTSQCQSGVAIVETQQSFVNGLVGGLTLGIYTPRTVKVTCASGSALAPGLKEFFVAHGASVEARESLTLQAIAESDRLGQPVVVRF